MAGKKYTHCNIDSGDYGDYLAKIEYSESSQTFGPSEVLFQGKWISIDEFDSMDGYNCYGCYNYRIEEPAAEEAAQ